MDGKRVAPSGKLVKRKGSALEKLSKKMKANEMTGKATGPIESKFILEFTQPCF